MQSIKVYDSVGQRNRMWATCELLNSLGATLKKKTTQGKLILIIILSNIAKILF